MDLLHRGHGQRAATIDEPDSRVDQNPGPYPGVPLGETEFGERAVNYPEDAPVQFGYGLGDRVVGACPFADRGLTLPGT